MNKFLVGVLFICTLTTSIYAKNVNYGGIGLVSYSLEDFDDNGQGIEFTIGTVKDKTIGAELQIIQSLHAAKLIEDGTLFEGEGNMVSFFATSLFLDFSSNSSLV